MTVPALTLVLAEIWPAGTVMVPEAGKALLELESDTDAPPVPAAAESVTVTVALAPLATVEGLTETPVRVAEEVLCGVTVTLAVLLTPE